MRKFLEKFFEYLHGAMVIASIVSLIGLLIALAGIEYRTIFFSGLSVLIPLVVSGIAEERIKSIYPFMLICLLSFVPVFFIAPNVVLKVVWIFLSIVVVVLRTVERLQDKKGLLSSPHAGTLLLFVALFFLATKLDNPFMMSLQYWFAFSYVILVMIYENMVRMDSYMDLNKDLSNVPKLQILRTNYMMLGIVLVLTLITMIFLPKTGLGELIKKLGEGLWSGIRWLISLIHFKESADVAETEAVAEATEAAMEQILPDAPPTPEWVTAVSNGITFAIFIVIMVFFAISVATSIYMIIKKFYRPYKENDDEQEFIELQTDEASFAGGDNGGKRPLWLSFSPAAQIRKTYKRTILHRKKKLSSTAFTPEEIENYAGLENDENRAVLHELYEKARYSREGVTREDLKRLK